MSPRLDVAGMKAGRAASAHSVRSMGQVDPVRVGDSSDNEGHDARYGQSSASRRRRLNRLDVRQIHYCSEADKSRTVRIGAN